MAKEPEQLHRMQLAVALVLGIALLSALSQGGSRRRQGRSGAPRVIEVKYDGVEVLVRRAEAAAAGRHRQRDAEQARVITATLEHILSGCEPGTAAAALEARARSASASLYRVIHSGGIRR